MQNYGFIDKDGQVEKEYRGCITAKDSPIIRIDYKRKQIYCTVDYYFTLKGLYEVKKFYDSVNSNI